MSESMGLPQRTRGWLRQAGRYWLPPLLWMAVMFVLSTDSFAAEHTGEVLWHVLSGLALHVTYEQYALLHFPHPQSRASHRICSPGGPPAAGVAGRAAGAWHWRWAGLSFVLVALHAGLDEDHQAYTQYRTGSVADSVLDMAGGLIALALLWRKRRKPAGRERHGAG